MYESLPESLPNSVFAPLDPAITEEISAVHAFYTALAPRLHPTHALGGQLLYAGQLSSETAHLIRAANIAGAASLSVSDSAPELRKATRDGVADFAVTSLDEALRILKNEIRKHLPVAVAIHGSPLDIANQMMLRGVQPDLLTPGAIQPLCARAGFLERGSQLVNPQPDDPQPGPAHLRIWQLPLAWNARSSELDAQLLELLPAGDHAARRWLRLSPRYLPRAARRLRSALCSELVDAQVRALLAVEPSAD
ncbi:MAG: hypothetical protein P4K83_00480 [Terracidiphilus sp.]|nr:hypothetical protein [Terracidiphilus sp.]